MSQHDFDIATADANTGTAFRAAVNAALQALATCSSGATAPATTYAYQLWFDTTTGLLKQRNATNTAWGPLKVYGITASLTEYADNAAALTAGLTAGQYYRTGDLVKVVH